MDKKTWIQALPKAEYHLHLEGAVPWHFIREASSEVLAEQPIWAASNYRYPDFSDFQQALSDNIRRVLVSLEDYQRLAQYQVQALRAENCLYAEISISVKGLHVRGIILDDLLKALRTIVPDDMTVAWIIGFGRGHDLSDEELADVIASPYVAGIDLYGDERLGNTERYCEIYAEAKRRGLRTKAHAGELLDSHSILEVLEKLEPERIQHGITGANDANLLKRLADDGLSLDLCPTSNLMLQVVPDLATYPIRKFLDAGLDITLNTDDPAMFCCKLSGELLLMLEHQLLSPREIANIQSHAFDKALMPKDVISAVQGKITAHLEAFESQNP